jgi:hypothetical protein
VSVRLEVWWVIATYSVTVIYFDSTYVFVLYVHCSCISSSNFVMFKKAFRIFCVLFKLITFARSVFKSFEMSSELLGHQVCQLVIQIGTTFESMDTLYFHVIELCDWLGTREVWTYDWVELYWTLKSSRLEVHWVQKGSVCICDGKRRSVDKAFSSSWRISVCRLLFEMFLFVNVWRKVSSELLQASGLCIVKFIEC